MFKEHTLYTWLQEHYVPDLTKAEGTYSKWDCVSADKKLIIELKCRRTHYDTLLIEKKKFDAITDRANELGYTAWYINSTPKGVYGWRLDKQDVVWKVENKHPATTDFNRTQRVAKEVGYLSLDDAHKFKEDWWK